MSPDRRKKAPNRQKKAPMNQSNWLPLLVVFVGAGAGFAYYSANSTTLPNSTAQPEFPDLGSLDWGVFALDSPPSVASNGSGQVELLVSPSQSVAQLKEQLEKQQHSVAGTLRVHPVMSATLQAVDFEVAAQHGAQIQAVGTRGATRWAWTIRPKPWAFGYRKLHLDVFAHVEVGGRERSFRIKTYAREIEVQIDGLSTLLAALNTPLGVVCAAALLGVLGWVARRHFAKEKSS